MSIAVNRPTKRVTLLALVIIAAQGAFSAWAQPLDERWFATGILRGDSRVLGPFKSLAACEDGRTAEAAKFKGYHDALAAKVPEMRSRALSAAKEGSYKWNIAQADLNDVLGFETTYQTLADLWGNGAICDRH